MGTLPRHKTGAMNWRGEKPRIEFSPASLCDSNREYFVNRILAGLMCMLCLLAANARAEAPKEEVKAPASAEIKQGLAGCAHCTFNASKQCLPALKLGDTVYLIKVDEKASESTKKLVASLAESKEPAKSVKFKGRPMEEKQAAALGSEIKSYYEIGEMSIQE
jgi:hypothetical protein